MIDTGGSYGREAYRAGFRMVDIRKTLVRDLTTGPVSRPEHPGIEIGPVRPDEVLERVPAEGVRSRIRESIEDKIGIQG